MSVERTGMRQWIAMAIVMLALGSVGYGQQSQPRRLMDAAGNVRDDAFVRTPLKPEDVKYADIDGARMKDIVREVSAISLKTRDDKTRYWGRIAGTSGEAMTAEWVEARFKKAGLVNMHRQDWVPALGLEQTGRAYARIIDEVNKLDRRQLVPATQISNAAPPQQ